MPIGYVQIPVGIAVPLLLDGMDFTIPMATTEPTICGHRGQVNREKILFDMLLDSFVRFSLPSLHVIVTYNILISGRENTF